LEVLMSSAGLSSLTTDVAEIASRLPTAPRLLVELNRLMNNRWVGDDEIVALLRQDPPLAAQLIRAANSAFYSPPEPVASLNRAIALVGTAETHRLVGAVAAAQLSEQKISLYPIDATGLRLNALFVAVLMEELAKWSEERPHSCYTVGLLRTIGMMALERMPSPAGVPLTPFAESGESRLDSWELKNWGMTSCQAAEMILLHWKLPRETVQAIRYHTQPEGRQNPIIHLLALAAGAAANSKYGIRGEEQYWPLPMSIFDQAGMSVTDYPRACEKAQRKFEQLRKVIA
jgi:HD-like signal output (HDOD) protein